MKIVYVSTLDRGGPLTHLRALAPAIARQGFDVHVLCASETFARELAAAGIRATVAPLRHKWDLAGGARIAGHLREADVVHTHDRRAGLFGRVLGALCGARAVHTLHGLPERTAVQVGRTSSPPGPPRAASRREWVQLVAERRLAALSTIVTPSRAMADWLIASGIARSRVAVIGHWMQVRRHEPRQRSETFVIGVSARLEWWKGLDVLIDACARVPACLRLEVFGDGSLRDTLARRAAQAGVAARFHGDVPDIHDRLGEIDVLVSPSRAENMPFAVLEAMAHGIPVIATRVGGVPEIVDHERTGLLVEPDDPASLAIALTLMQRDPALAARYGRAGAARLAREFNEACVVPCFVALYDGMARRARLTTTH